MNRSSYFLFLFCLTLGGLWSCHEDFNTKPVQFPTIRGQVLCNTTKKPVSKALVRLSPSGRTLETDSGGRFRFDSLSVGW